MREQTWLSKIMFFLNIVLAILTFLAYTLPFLTPKAFPILSVLTLGLPLFLFFIFYLNFSAGKGSILLKNIFLFYFQCAI